MSEAPRGGRRQAVALAYRHGDKAPQLVAKGYGDTAERIIEAAREHDIFVHDAPALVNMLMQLDLDEKVPPELYLVVAELLIWVRDLVPDSD